MTTAFKLEKNYILLITAANPRTAEEAVKQFDKLARAEVSAVRAGILGDDTHFEGCRYRPYPLKRFSQTPDGQAFVEAVVTARNDQYVTKITNLVKFINSQPTPEIFVRSKEERYQLESKLKDLIPEYHNRGTLTTNVFHIDASELRYSAPMFDDDSEPQRRERVYIEKINNDEDLNHVLQLYDPWIIVYDIWRNGTERSS